MELPDVPLFRGLTARRGRDSRNCAADAPQGICQGGNPAGGRAEGPGAGRCGWPGGCTWSTWTSGAARRCWAQAGPGDLFAETYACLPDEPLRVSVVAAENGEALFLETGQLLQCGCEPWRWKLTQNLLRIAARKNLGLAQRSLYTAPKTIRRADHGVLLGAGAAKRQPAVYAPL